MNENNKVFELSDEELAKVVGGGGSDVPTVTPPGGDPSAGSEGDYGIPGAYETPCGIRLPTIEQCPADVINRIYRFCPTCPCNY